MLVLLYFVVVFSILFPPYIFGIGITSPHHHKQFLHLAIVVSCILVMFTINMALHKLKYYRYYKIRWEQVGRIESIVATDNFFFYQKTINHHHLASSIHFYLFIYFNSRYTHKQRRQIGSAKRNKSLYYKTKQENQQDVGIFGTITREPK